MPLKCIHSEGTTFDESRCVKCQETAQRFIAEYVTRRTLGNLANVAVKDAMREATEEVAMELWPHLNWSLIVK